MKIAFAVLGYSLHFLRVRPFPKAYFVRHPSCMSIQYLVADHFGIDPREMSSSRRLRAAARARQVAMYLIRRHTGASLPDIGRRMGGRDHTTVMHGIRRVEELIASDPAFASAVAECEARIAA